MERVYLDSAAGTAPSPRVLRAMASLTTCEANPASIHREGRVMQQALKSARARIAQLMHALPEEIVFTSGGTEGNALALHGVLTRGETSVGRGHTPKHLIISAIEHSSVYEAARLLKERGTRLSVLPVDSDGLVSVQQLRAALTPRTALISLVWVHHEFGTVQNVRAFARILKNYRRERGNRYPLLHIDACQAPRFFAPHVDRLGVDLMTLNGSKMYGPHGSGILYVRRGTPLAPLFVGGGQEGGIRAGTPHVAAAVGLAEALTECEQLRARECARLTPIRDALIAGLAQLPGALINGPMGDARAPHNVHLSFPQLLGEQLVLELDAAGFAVSTGSACTLASGEYSHALRALGAPRSRARGALRITLGRSTPARVARSLPKALSAILKRYAHTPTTTLRV